MLAILKSYRSRIDDDRRFLAAIQGIDMDSPEDEKEDIASLRDRKAEFGVGMGLGYAVEGVE